MRKKYRSKGNYLKYISIALVVVFLIAAALMLVELWDNRSAKFKEYEFGNTTIKYNGKEYSFKENIETFLVIGLDKYTDDAKTDSYNNDKQADFLMLFVFNNNTKQYSAIHINRDTMTDVNILGVAGNRVDTQTKQVALAHTYGNGDDVSCRNTADSVSSILYGIKVDHYISFTMDAVTVLNDAVGGVEVEVLDDFTGINDSLVKGEIITLKGEQAITYVRSRQGLEDSTNVARMERQQQYIDALQKKIEKCAAKSDEFIVETTLELADYIVSDRSINQLQKIADKFNNYEFLGIIDIEGESVVGKEFMEFYPDEKTLKKMVVDVFYNPKKR